MLKSALKRIALFISIIAITLAGCLSYVRHVKASDSYVRDAVVLLYGAGGSCTGVQVKLRESKKAFVLTAAHCLPLVEEGKINAKTESGEILSLKVLEEDTQADLLLLEGSDQLSTVILATDAELHDRVHTVTHGAGAPAYRTDGELLDEVEGGFIHAISTSGASLPSECTSMPKYKLIVDPQSGSTYCVLNVYSAAATAQAIPGSSGGPLLNEAGELVGIVSYGNPNIPTFSYYVTQHDIEQFLFQVDYKFKSTN